MDDRRKRLLYRATHRGTKEADALIGGYFTDRAGGLSDAELAQAEALLEENDLDLVDWVVGRQAVPLRWQGSMLDEIAARYRAKA